MRADAKAIDAVALLVQAENRLLVDVIAGDNRELGESRHRKPLSHRFECVARQHRQIRQITRIDANADRFVALIVQRQRNGAEIHQAAPERKQIGVFLVLGVVVVVVAADCERID